MSNRHFDDQHEPARHRYDRIIEMRRRRMKTREIAAIVGVTPDTVREKIRLDNYTGDYDYRAKLRAQHPGVVFLYDTNLPQLTLNAVKNATGIHEPTVRLLRSWYEAGKLDGARNIAAAGRRHIKAVLEAYPDQR